MSVDRLFKSNDRHFISPVVNLGEFLSEATAQEEKLRNFFKIPAHHLNNGTVQGQESGGSSLPFTINDSREQFRQFMVQHGQSAEAATNTIVAGDEVIANVLEKIPVDEYEITFPPKGSKLMTHKILNDIRQASKTNNNYIKTTINGRGKYFKYRDQELRRYYTEQGATAEKDVLLTVHLLKPMNRPPVSELENLNLKHKCELKMLVRGYMPLVKLREKIFCASDFWSNCEDFEEAPMHNSFYFTEKFPSNFIFIHDTFYVDLRHPKSTDITQPIQEFMKRKHQDLGPFFIKDMADIRVIDLKLRLGQPYLFMHQGRCEHLLVFTDLRLLNASDQQQLDNYPIRLFDVTPYKICSVCDTDGASFVVTESDRLPMSPTFFCSKCFTAFHYNQGQRIGNFKAYHFINHAGTE